MITRHSKQRDALIDILCATDSHPTADKLYMELREDFPNISLATVYRNLKQLVEAGKILELSTGSGKEHYDGATHCHYHFVCKDCGEVSDLNVEPFKNLEQQLSKDTGNDIDGYSLMFYGTCRNCKNKNSGGN